MADPLNRLTGPGFVFHDVDQNGPDLIHWRVLEIQKFHTRFSIVENGGKRLNNFVSDHGSEFADNCQPGWSSETFLGFFGPFSVSDIGANGLKFGN